jgi:hypothetical protein
MKLFAKLNSERGKEITKSGNDWLKIEVQDENRNIIFTKILYAGEKCRCGSSECDTVHFKAQCKNPY